MTMDAVDATDKTTITTTEKEQPNPHEPLFRGMVNILNLLRSGAGNTYSNLEFRRAREFAASILNARSRLDVAWYDTERNAEGNFSHTIGVQLPNGLELIGTAIWVNNQHPIEEGYKFENPNVILRGSETESIATEPEEIITKLRELSIDLTTPEGQEALAAAINAQATSQPTS